MKKRVNYILLIIFFLLIDATIGYAKQNKKNLTEDIKAIYISYLEYLDNFVGNSKSINEKKIDKMIDNINNLGFNWIIVHVSPFSDSIYNSKYFPYSHTLTGMEGKNPGFDYLEYFIKSAHQKKISVHAWINPYRISDTQNIDKLSKENPAYNLIGTTHVKIDGKGIYYNPASEIVKNILLDQIDELIRNYDIDGIHFDDYFYIQNDIDEYEYNNYINNVEYISKSTFRLNTINDFIKRVYKLIKKRNQNIIFSIAPDGNINNNYKYHFADVKEWLKKLEYVDVIMPQIYYGFDNQYKPFEQTVKEWQNINEKNIKMVPVLAFYKLGKIDEDAGSGMNEWKENKDIIMKQINYINNQLGNGYALFRYDFLFNENYVNDNILNEIENIKKNG